MSDVSIAIKTGTAIIGTIKRWLDPNVGIEEATDEYVLGEFPRSLKTSSQLCRS